MNKDSRSEEFFDAMYRKDEDPWRFATSRYEQDRYGAIMGCLKERRFRRAFEPGCSIGVLTELLAGICGQVEAMDISATAVERTRTRCMRLPGVKVERGTLPANLPGGVFDLIVFSEVGYYFEVDALKELIHQMVARLDGQGVLIAAHWLGSSPDHVLSGDEVHEAIGANAALEPVRSERHEGFRLDQWARK